jgi:hypothetical protein
VMKRREEAADLAMKERARLAERRDEAAV